jgi:hypothetical protein
MEGVEVEESKQDVDFLGMNPIQVLDDMVNAVEDYLCDGMDTLEKKIAADSGTSTKKGKLAVGKGIDKIFDQLESNVAKNMDKFELYMLQSVCKVPEGLGEGSPSAAQPASVDPVAAAEQNAALDASLAEVYSELVRAYHVGRSLRKEHDSITKEMAALQAASSSSLDASVTARLREVVGMSSSLLSQVQAVSAQHSSSSSGGSSSSSSSSSSQAVKSALSDSKQAPISTAAANKFTSILNS